MGHIKIKKENDQIFKNNGFAGMSSEYIKDFTPVKMVRSSHYTLTDNIVPMTTVECIISNRDKNMIALNFANAIVAGGAYIIGGTAQEESLCRASGLYYTIKSTKEFYSENRKHILADYTDGMIYSQNVPVIRNNAGEMLESPVLCNFITCPAVNRYEAFMIPSSKLDDVMKRRIEKIVSFAQSQKPDLIILGAFGCGAFGNKRDTVFPQFEQAINEYTDSTADIVFAVP